MQDNRRPKSTDADTEAKREKKTKPEPMQIASYVFVMLFGILGVLAAVFFSVGHRDVGIWTSCAAVMMAVAGGFCWYQDIAWQRDAVSASTESNDRARISIDDGKLIFSEDGKAFTYQLIVHNYGKRPAHIQGYSFNYISGGDEEILPDNPSYWPPDPFAAILHPEQKVKVLDDKWFPRLPEDADIICCWGLVKYLSEGSTIEHVVGYGFRWRNGKEITMIRKPGYNYDE